MRTEFSLPARSVAVNTVLLYPDCTTRPMLQSPFSAMVAANGPDVTVASGSLVPVNSTTLVVTLAASSGETMTSGGAVMSAGALVDVGAWVVVAASTVSVGSSTAASMGSVGKDWRASDPAVDTETARTADATLPEMTPS